MKASLRVDKESLQISALAGPGGGRTRRHIRSSGLEDSLGGEIYFISRKFMTTLKVTL